jgi:hypothetical protein
VYLLEESRALAVGPAGEDLADHAIIDVRSLP